MSDTETPEETIARVLAEHREIAHPYSLGCTGCRWQMPLAYSFTADHKVHLAAEVWAALARREQDGAS